MSETLEFLLRQGAILLFAAEFVEQIGVPLRSSIYRDLRKGAPVEVDEILGDLVERSRRLGITVPLLSAAYINLGVYQTSPSNHHERLGEPNKYTDTTP